MNEDCSSSAVVDRSVRQPRSVSHKDVMQRAIQGARKQEQYSQGHFSFISIWDHILPSQCSHPKGEPTPDCSLCLFERELAALPHFPEMIFPSNRLTIIWKNRKDVHMAFDALSALKMVDTTKLPDLQVASSAEWQETRKGMPEYKEFGKPFDWTYTSEYMGTLTGLKEEETEERIDMEFLKRQDPIEFYAQTTLYEDELHDHGCAQMTCRIRVMPSWFFVLIRFYLRIDHVHVRICDTRVFGRTGDEHVLREWTLREQPISQLAHIDADILRDQNQVWMHLPVVKQVVTKISPL